MLAEVFYWLLNMSIAGSFAGCILLLLRRIKGFPRAGIYALWIIPLLRFWFPFGISGNFSFFALFPRNMIRGVELPGHTLLAMNFAQAAENYFPITFKTAVLERVFSIGSLVWLIVCIAAWILLCCFYFLGKSEIKDAKPDGNGVYCSESITAPAVYGILRPRIMFPMNFPEATFPYALLHERAHVDRLDNLFRCIAIVTVCLHWFNPLAWVLLRCFFEDMELACDARVLKKLSEPERKAYAESLLSAAAGRSLFASEFGGAKIRLRIEKILSYHKLTLVAGIAFGLLSGAVFLALLLNSTGGAYGF